MGPWRTSRRAALSRGKQLFNSWNISAENILSETNVNKDASRQCDSRLPEEILHI